MTRDDIRAFARAHRLAVLAITTADGSPQAAIVGVAVTDDLELIFDTLNTSRKYANLKANPRAAFVLGDGAQTLQVEGIAEELADDALARCKPLYFAVWPDGPARELAGYQLFPGSPDLAALQRFWRGAGENRGDDGGLGGWLWRATQ